MRILAAILLLAAGTDAKEPAANPFKSGNEAYQHKKFQAALAHYQKQIDSNHTSAEVHFNLANAALQDQQLGRAVFHYRRAQAMAPRDKEIAHNLELARNAVHQGSPPKPSLWQKLTGFLTMNEWALLAGLPLTAWLAWLALINFRPEWETAGALIRPVLGTLALVLSIVALIAYDLQTNTHWLVVTSPETSARFGPVEVSPEQFKWFDGTELAVDQVHNDWVYARDATGRQGWVDTQDTLHPGPWQQSALRGLFGGFAWWHWLLGGTAVAGAIFGLRRLLKKVVGPSPAHTLA